MDIVTLGLDSNFSCWRLCYYLVCMLVLHRWYVNCVKDI